MKDLAEVCPLSREVLLQPLSTPLQDGFRFFPRSFTRSLIGAPCGCLPQTEEIGLTVFHLDNRVG